MFEVIGNLLGAVNPMGILLNAILTLLSDFITGLLLLPSSIFESTSARYEMITSGGPSSIWVVITGISLTLATILFILGLIHAMFTGNPANLKNVAIGIFFAISAPQAALAIVPLVNKVFVEVGQYLATLGGANLGELFEGMTQTSGGLSAPATPAIVTLIVLLMYVIGICILFMVMWVIGIAQIVTLCLSPFAAAGLSGPPQTRGWFGKWMEIQFGLSFAYIPIGLLIFISSKMLVRDPTVDATWFDAFSLGAGGAVIGIGAIAAPILGVMMFGWAGGVATAGVGNAASAVSGGLKSAAGAATPAVKNALGGSGGGSSSAASAAGGLNKAPMSAGGLAGSAGAGGAAGTASAAGTGVGLPLAAGMAAAGVAKAAGASMVAGASSAMGGGSSGGAPTPDGGSSSPMSSAGSESLGSQKFTDTTSSGAEKVGSETSRVSDGNTATVPSASVDPVSTPLPIPSVSPTPDTGSALVNEVKKITPPPNPSQ